MGYMYAYMRVMTIDQKVLIKAGPLRCPGLIVSPLELCSHINYLTYPRIVCWSSGGSTVKSPVSLERPDVGRVIIACGRDMA